MNNFINVHVWLLVPTRVSKYYILLTQKWPWNTPKSQHKMIIKVICDEWGGAESRGNGARPVEWMIMNDTCATHRSRVPRRSFGRVKWGVTTLEDERGPGLAFTLCFVCGSRPWGAAAFLLCLFIWLLKCLNVRRFPPPSSRTYQLRYIGEKRQPLTDDCHTQNIK